jgi:hypothetical protein
MHHTRGGNKSKHLSCSLLYIDLKLLGSRGSKSSHSPGDVHNQFSGRVYQRQKEPILKASYTYKVLFFFFMQTV